MGGSRDAPLLWWARRVRHGYGVTARPQAPARTRSQIRRDGQDGFCITTYAPGPGAGPAIARAFEAGTLNYDYMLYRTCVSVSADMAMLVDRRIALDREVGRRGP